MFSGLPCKTHIAHIEHIARTRGRVEVQRVGVHIAHMAHIAWSWGRVEVQRLGCRAGGAPGIALELATSLFRGCFPNGLYCT